MLEPRPWHKMYEQLGASPEVQMLNLLEPEDFDEDEEWAIQLRQEFPTVPPAGIEMCHKNWLIGLDLLIESIGNEEYQRKNYWCGDVPNDIIFELGMRRRILQFWLKGKSEDDAQDNFAENIGETPNLVRVYYAILGDLDKASFEIKQDVQNIVDILVGPYIKAGEALSAKWKITQQQQKQRNSILQDLDESVVTCLCNYYTPKNIDALIRMIARQHFNPTLVGGCNNSMKFMMQDKPQILLGSMAIVWTCYLFAAAELGNKTVNPPEVDKDMAYSAMEKLGNSNPLKLWLVASLGLLVKAWIKRAWVFMNAEVKRNKLPNFIFDLHAPKKAGAKTSKAPKLKTAAITSDEDSVEDVEVELLDVPEIIEESKNDHEPAEAHAETVAEMDDDFFANNDFIHEGATGSVSFEELEQLVEQEESEFNVNTITGAMTTRYAHGYITQRILDSESLRKLETTEINNAEKKDEIVPQNIENHSSSESDKTLNDPMVVKIKKPDGFNENGETITTEENAEPDDNDSVSDEAD